MRVFSFLTETMALRRAYMDAVIRFHPSDSKLLGIAADTTGHLGFWDVDGKNDDDEPVVYTYRPHTRTITHLKFHPKNPSKLYTSSYDSTVQCFDMQHAKFETVSFAENEYDFTHFDMVDDLFWFCTSDGEVGSRDLRSDSSKAKVHSVRDKKVGCVSAHKTEPLLALASNDRTMTLWDTRKLKEPLHTYEHGYAVTSAYWSPQGDRLVSTSYDDLVRIFDLQPNKSELAIQKAIPHNNHTGRWVTNLRARWNEAPGYDHQHFVIGSMNHPVEIYSGETGDLIHELYDEDRITAVPAVTQFHPTRESMTILCGNGSGRMVCWT